MPSTPPALLRRPAALIAVFAIVQLCIAFLTETQTFTHEESMWHYIGRNWFRHGLTPYAGGVDNKSPLIFAVFGLSDALFGINYWFPKIIGVIVQSAGLLYLYRIALALTKDAQIAIVSLTMYGLAILWHVTGGKYVSFTETYAVTFILASIYYYITGRKVFISGLLAGIAICWRITALFGAFAVMLQKRNAVLPFIAGIITAIGGVLLLLMAAGISAQELYIYAFADNFTSGSTTDHPFSWRIEQFTGRFFYSELVLFYIPLAAYFFSNRKNRLLTTWLIAEFLGINIIGIYAYPHFKQLLPPLCLISGIALAEHFKEALIITWIAFFPKVTEPITGLKKMFTGRLSSEQKEKELGLWIRDNTKPTDLVLVAGFGARVQLYSERLSPTIYFNVTQTPRAKAQFMQDVNLHKPQLIAIPNFAEYKNYVSADLRSFIDSTAAANYSMIKNYNGYNIYFLKDKITITTPNTPNTPPHKRFTVLASSKRWDAKKL